jgi:hypothetical protein
MFTAAVSMGLLWSGYLDKGKSVTMWFWPFQSSESGRREPPPSIWAQPAGGWISWEPQYWFTITPINPPLAHNLVPYDQQVGITEVSWFAKGEAHELDGSGGAGDLLLQITVRNYLDDAPANFDVWELRADADLKG